MDATTSVADSTRTRPHRFRFRLRTLLLAFSVASLALAALRYCNYAWACGVTTVTVLSLFAAAIFAVYSTPNRRPFWVGFIVFCGGYVLLMVLSCSNVGGISVPFFIADDDSEEGLGAMAEYSVAYYLGTTRLVDFARDKMHPDLKKAALAARNAAPAPVPQTGGVTSASADAGKSSAESDASGVSAAVDQGEQDRIESSVIPATATAPAAVAPTTQLSWQSQLEPARRLLCFGIIGHCIFAWLLGGLGGLLGRFACWRARAASS